MLLAQAICAVALAALHIWAQRIPSLDRVPRSWMLSAAGGISVAYVFAHLLPEMHALQLEIAGSFSGVLATLESHIYLFALVGLVVFYALEHQAIRVRQHRRRVHGEDQTDARTAWIAFGSYAAYNALVGYLVSERTDPMPLLLFAGALGVHFFVVDHALRDHHGASYRRYGRWVCGAAVFLGWILGSLLELPTLVVAGVLGFLAGGVVMNSIKEELPRERESRLLPFITAAAAYAVLLLVA